MTERVTVRVGGVETKMPFDKAFVQQTKARALSGDRLAMKFVDAWIRSFGLLSVDEGQIKVERIITFT